MNIGFAGLLLIAIVVIGGFSLLVPAPVIAAATVPDTAGRALVERFVGRSRRFRTIGGLIGIITSIVITSARANAATEGSISINLLPALAGAVLGSIVAESFRIRQAKGPRTASLGIRQEVDYSDTTADTRERVIGIIAGTLTVLGVMQGNWLTIGLGGIILAIGLIRRWAQQRVVTRGRPVLDPELEAADDAVRRMAVRHGLARPTVTLMTLLAAGQAAALQAGYGETSGTNQVLGLGSLALSITGVVWWWTNRNFGFATANAKRTRSALVAGLIGFALLFFFLIAARAIS